MNQNFAVVLLAITGHGFFLNLTPSDWLPFNIAYLMFTVKHDTHPLNVRIFSQ